MLKDKKGGTGYDLAFYSKTKQESFNGTRWCLFTKIYIDLFSGVFSTKMKRTNTLKVEYTIEMKFLSGNWISGRENTSKFTHVHWWTPSPGFSLSRQHVDDEPSM